MKNLPVGVRLRLERQDAKLFRRQEMTYLVKNADNDHLEPTGNDRLVFGCVDEVNGRGAQEIPEFIPTRHELLELAKYWAREATRTYFFCWSVDQSGSTEIRLIPFAWRRVERIAELLGEDEVNQAVDTAVAAFGEEQGNDVIWTTFQEGGSMEDLTHFQPQDATGYEARGLAHAFMGQFPEAVADYNQAINLNATADMYSYRGQAYKMMGQNEKAIADFDRASRARFVASRGSQPA